MINVKRKTWLEILGRRRAEQVGIDSSENLSFVRYTYPPYFHSFIEHNAVSSDYEAYGTRPC